MTWQKVQSKLRTMNTAARDRVEKVRRTLQLRQMSGVSTIDVLANNPDLRQEILGQGNAPWLADYAKAFLLDPSMEEEAPAEVGLEEALPNAAPRARAPSARAMEAAETEALLQQQAAGGSRSALAAQAPAQGGATAAIAAVAEAPPTASRGGGAAGGGAQRRPRSQQASGRAGSSAAAAGDDDGDDNTSPHRPTQRQRTTPGTSGRLPTSGAVIGRALSHQTAGIARAVFEAQEGGAHARGADAMIAALDRNTVASAQVREGQNMTQFAMLKRQAASAAAAEERHWLDTLRSFTADERIPLDLRAHIQMRVVQARTEADTARAEAVAAETAATAAQQRVREAVTGIVAAATTAQPPAGEPRAAQAATEAPTATATAVGAQALGAPGGEVEVVEVLEGDAGDGNA